MFRSSALRLLRTADRLALVMRTLRSRTRFDGQRTVRRGNHWFIAQVRSARPVPELVRETLDLVVTAVERSGVGYFVLPSTDGLATRVAVRQGTGELLAALKAVAGDQPLYVRALAPRSRRALLVADADAWPPGEVVRVFRNIALADGGLLVGEEHGCDVVVSREVDGCLEIGLDNHVAERVPAEIYRGQVARIEVLGQNYRTRDPLGETSFVGMIDFPIDVVYTWVDGGDPVWQARRDAHISSLDSTSDEAVNPSRWIDRQELRYSLRSLHMHTGWVNHVYLVTEGHVPSWLDTSHPDLTVVSHEQIFPDPAVLPTFNSHAIEANLHRIPGLSEHFVYFNDDVHLGHYVRPEQFYLSNGIPRFFPSRHQLDLGPARADDPPVMAAGKNSRDLLRDSFGRSVTQKLKHVPHALRRSTMERIHEEFPEQIDRTSRSRFRSPTDVSFVSAFAHWYGYLLGQAVPGEISYRYIDLVTPDLKHLLDRILEERAWDVLCVNDTKGSAEDVERGGATLVRFLERYLPLPSPFERT